jgi:hypothetical protein
MMESKHDNNGSDQKTAKRNDGKTQTKGELKGNATAGETPGSNKSERTGKAKRPNKP